MLAKPFKPFFPRDTKNWYDQRNLGSDSFMKLAKWIYDISWSKFNVETSRKQILSIIF